MKYLSKILIGLLIILFINLNVFRDAYSFLFTSIFNYIYKLDNEEKLYQEFIYYKNHIGDYKDMYIELQSLKSQNKELLNNLEYMDSTEEIKKDKSLVITRNIESWNQNVIINKNYNSNQVVINNKGLVGIIENSSLNSSKVKLLTSSSFGKIAVKIVDGTNTHYGIMDNYDSKKNTFKINGISEKVSIDAIVLTSELSTKIKGNIKIGTIKAIETDQYDLEKTLIVKPYVDFSNIKYVYVIEE